MKNKFNISILILIFLAVGFWFIHKNNKEKEVIDLTKEIIKNEDEINQMKIGQNEKVQIKFSWEIDGMKYNDAIYVNKEDYEKFSSSDIEKMKKERFENWAKNINVQSKKESESEISETNENTI